MTNVLYVEDDPTTAKSVELMLTHAGMEVVHLDNGDDVSEFSTIFNFDIILLDLNLPMISGHDVLRQLRGRGDKTPVMALTGDDSLDSKLKFFGFDGNDYLTKPFHRQELIARINAIVERTTVNAASSQITWS